MEVTRRRFLAGILALGATPAIVRASSIMRVRPVLYPGHLGVIERVTVGDTGRLALQNEYRRMARDKLAAWWGEQFDRLLIEQYDAGHRTGMCVFLKDGRRGGVGVENAIFGNDQGRIHEALADRLIGWSPEPIRVRE